MSKVSAGAAPPPTAHMPVSRLPAPLHPSIHPLLSISCLSLVCVCACVCVWQLCRCFRGPHRRGRNPVGQQRGKHWQRGRGGAASVFVVLCRAVGVCTAESFWSRFVTWLRTTRRWRRGAGSQRPWGSPTVYSLCDISVGVDTSLEHMRLHGVVQGPMCVSIGWCVSCSCHVQPSQRDGVGGGSRGRVGVHSSFISVQ